MEPVKVGIIQASPVFMDIGGSLKKAVQLIEQAANDGVRLVTFGETWLPGYPAWLDYCPAAARWNHRPTKEVFARLRQTAWWSRAKKQRRSAKLPPITNWLSSSESMRKSKAGQGTERSTAAC